MIDFADLVANIPKTTQADDYLDADGLLCCGKCHTRKESRYAVNGKIITARHMCKCEFESKEKREAEAKAAAFRQECERLRKDGIADASYLGYDFAHDDCRNAKVSDVCKKYVEHWDEMCSENIGVLFYGGTGTGKTFLACSIANALIDQGIKSMVTSLPRVLRAPFTGGGHDILDSLNRYELLVIDDLGAERNTAYAMEQVFGIVDARIRCAKPLIVTTNLTVAEMQSPATIDLARIYDRILEMCPIRLKLAGESGRIASAKKRREKAREILGL